MINIQCYNPEQFLTDLKRNKQPFILEKTLYTKRIYCKFGKLVWNQKTELKFKDLNFINSVRRHAEKLNNIPEYLNRKNIYYINKNSDKPKNFSKNIYEIDLSGAYWELAYKNNYISYEIYKSGLEVKKKVRLMALGNLAKRTAVMQFNGNEFLPITYKESQKTKNIFFDVAKQTDEIMRKMAILCGNDYIFYWVDAIFFRGEKNFEILKEWLEANEIKFKTIRIKEIKITKNNIFVNDENEQKRNFNF